MRAQLVQEGTADVQVPARLTQRENLILAAFSVLYTINIAVSNISLQLVTVPVRQSIQAGLTIVSPSRPGFHPVVYHPDCDGRSPHQI